MTFTRRLVLGAGAAGLVGAQSVLGRGALAQGSGPIRIATAGPMTGQYAAFGAQMRAGAEQAVTDINGAGGVLGRQLALEVGDDACDPRQAVSVANQLAGRRVVFVAGHYCSGSSIPARDVYAEEGVLQMSPASTNPRFTDEGKWNTFRVCGRDDQQGLVAGTYMARNMQGRRIAILHDNSAYGKGLADETKKALNAAGVQETLYAAYTPGERDYNALVSRMKAADIQVIYVGGYHTEAGLILRQAKEQGMNVTLIGGDALVTNEFWQITGAAGEGTLMTFSSDPRRRPTAAEVVQRFRARNVDPEGYVLYTYAAVQIFAAAAGRGNTVDPRRLAALLKSGGPWQTVLGDIGFDAKGDVTAPDYVFYVWRNGSYAEM
ncbi:branched-chain amino acid ABC transporter substrate-binding protein [Plastoroseomonas hellenica]|uniref:Branched-chain amino acid ABC transporter substrate-binding protein n=1 Tax=Plastoroseomonas hellenica TaxID=2687306 RepID=A0ABS5EX25_9PROT|nr:branched-chain amino acid ABC transporter substrate-binding protein [Plastoroseomonas hellenica]MBR0642613.1 branched-chain amino acid ABC transporter substrate-binding protein [Plastoroseomonas hellenica]MBR0664826.1 branched-chain amino acid ABC transporter substrate-binding protein [Plastoroseomonas hellenica]